MDIKKLKKQRETAAKLSRPRPIELPSGKWRCQVMVAGKRIDVIEDDPTVAHARALAVKAGLLEEKRPASELTVGEAIDRYIESKDAVLSPSTVAGYKRVRENALQDIMSIRLSELSQERIQRAVNKMAKDKSSKSVRNAHGLLSAVLAEYKPDMVLRTTLPQKQKPEISIPTDEDIGHIMQAVVGTEIELPVLLAIWLGLRVSEIRGLTWSCISGDIIHIKQAIVEGENGPEVKGTKTYSGDRKLRLPPYLSSLIERQPRTDDYIVHMSGQAIYKRFVRLCEKEGLPHFRFHDLRHANASVMLALGVPDKYAMERMGHASNNMLKTVYQHTMKSKQEEVADMVDDYFTEKLHTNLHTAQ